MHQFHTPAEGKRNPVGGWAFQPNPSPHKEMLHHD